MTPFRRIRLLLGVTQEGMAEALDMSQGNVSFLENGQTVTPDVAQKVIAFATTRGLTLTFGQVYGAEPLPVRRAAPAEAKAVLS